MPTLPQIIATATNPILTLLLVGAPFYTERRTGPAEFWLRSGLGIGLAVGLAESGKWFRVWPGHPAFPSGHAAFGLAAAISLIARDRRWLAPALPLSLLLSWGLVAAHYHEPVDVAGSWILAPPCALLCQWWRRKRPD